MSYDTQFYMAIGKPLAAGDTNTIQLFVKDLDKEHVFNGGLNLFLTVDMAGYTGTATADIELTLNHGTAVDASGAITDTAPLCTYTIPATLINKGKRFVAMAPVYTLPYQNITIGAIAGITGGSVTIGYTDRQGACMGI